MTFEVSSSERDLRDRCAIECILWPIAFGGLLQERTVREKIERSEAASAARRRFLLCGGEAEAGRRPDDLSKKREAQERLRERLATACV